MGLLERALTESTAAKSHSGLLERANLLQTGSPTLLSPKKKALRKSA
jgi:hypothetical protein